jgi:hypothetical protein
MGTGVWPLAVIIFGTVLPVGWTVVLVLLLLELELIRPWLVPVVECVDRRRAVFAAAANHMPN